MSHVKLMKAVNDNKPLLAFLSAVFVAGWQMSVLYSDYLSHKKDAATKSEVSELKTEIAVLKSQVEILMKGGNYSKTSVLIADLNTRLKYCNRMKDTVTKRANFYYSKHSDCEEEIRTQYAKF